jgi:hypothetical protein
MGRGFVGGIQRAESTYHLHVQSHNPEERYVPGENISSKVFILYTEWTCVKMSF